MVCACGGVGQGSLQDVSQATRHADSWPAGVVHLFVVHSVPRSYLTYLTWLTYLTYLTWLT